ncbi:MAG: rod shape-determining protein MreC [Proteobacteria bacterium]|nr:rod shape-determining protein MreC [Pseudomonadota bacterium]
MALPDKESSPIFADAAAGTLRLIGYLALACVLMVLDHRNDWLHRARVTASLVVEPVYRLAAWPAEAAQDAGVAFSQRRALIDENRQLREALLLAQARLNRMNAVTEQNARLKQLLETRRMLGMNVQLARLINVDLGAARNRVMIDAGSREGVRVGQVVIDAHGVMGQVVEVLPHSATVLLITDANHSIPVVDERSGLRGIAHGSNVPDRLLVSDIPLSADVKVGDRVTTSGLGGRFPAGFPVGTIESIGPDPSGMFAQAIARPAAALARSGEVLLLRDLPEQVGPPTVAPEFGPPASLAPAGNAAAAPNDPAAAAALQKPVAATASGGTTP